MEILEIHGGKNLFGNVTVPSSKNATLPILAGCILCNKSVTLQNIAAFDDIVNMCNILQTLGVKIHKNKSDLILDCSDIFVSELPPSQTKLLRSSIFCLGPMIGRLRRAKIAYPGGCAIGSRPIDIHLEGLKALGVKIDEQENFLVCDGAKLKPNDINLRFASVGATENLMMACAYINGTSRIFNAAKEPEIVDLQNFLNKMGASIKGAGTNIITIKGNENLGDAVFEPIPDRIIAGTYLTAVAMTGGKITIENVNFKHLKSLIKKIDNKCCKIVCKGDKIVVESDGMPEAFGHIQTAPYPGFPTDLQSQMVSLASVCKGKSVVSERIFETRFKHVPQLQKMGANIRVFDNTAFVDGSKLYGANVEAADLRSGAALVCAGLVAKGVTTVGNVKFIDRGYNSIEKVFASLGADIKRIKIEEESNNC